MFYGSEAAFDARADADLYNEFLTKVLNVPTDYEEPDKVELWKALADPAYFQGNVDYYIKNRGQATVTDDEGNTIEFNPVEGDPYNQTTSDQAVRRQRFVRCSVPQSDRGPDPHAGRRGLHELQQRTHGGL